MAILEEYLLTQGKKKKKNVNQEVEPQPTTNIAQQVEQRTEELLDPNKSGAKGFLGNLWYGLKRLYTGTEDAVAGWGRSASANALNQVKIGQEKGAEQVKEENKQLAKKAGTDYLNAIAKGPLSIRWCTISIN